MLYWANHSQIRWADQIDIGQVLKVPVKSAKMPSAPATSPAPASSGSVAGQCVHRAGRPQVSYPRGRGSYAARVID